jgi:hypothetical protein
MARECPPSHADEVPTSRAGRGEHA